MKLYEITHEIERLLAELDAGTLEEYQASERLDQLNLEGEAKISNICALLKNLEAERIAFDAESDRLKARAHSLAHRINWLKGYVGSAIGEGNTWKNGVHELNWWKSQFVDIDMAVLPDEWWRVRTVKEPNKEELRKALKSQTIRGAELRTRYSLQVS